MIGIQGSNLNLEFTMFSHLAMVGACHINAGTSQFYRSVPDKDNIREIDDIWCNVLRIFLP